MWPHRRQPTRLPRPWDSPGKNTGVGCHFLLQCMKVKSESEVAQSCPTPSNPMECSLPGSSIREIFQARVLEWGAIAFSILPLYLPSIVQIPIVGKSYLITNIRNSAQICFLNADKTVEMSNNSAKLTTKIQHNYFREELVLWPLGLYVAL